MLKYSKANTKLRKLNKVRALKKYLTGKRKVYSFDILSGWSCPAAKDCLSKAIEVDGRRKIQDGKHTQFRCFSASQEAQYPDTYNKRKANFDAVKACKNTDEMVDLLSENLPEDAGIVRWHVSGDLFNEMYFRALIRVAANNPTVLFYAYTKQLRLWVKLADRMPENLVMTASRGGKHDALIDQHGLREARVVFSHDEAKRLGLDIDSDDSHAARPDLRDQSFALLIHASQPKGSRAAAALQVLKGREKSRKG